MKILPKRDVPDETFATVLERGLGKTICANFYFPYARKLWALAPEELSATQARKRVSASSFSKLARRLASAVPGLRNGKTGYFYYPRKGYGEISERLFGAAKDTGADFRLGAKVAAVASSDGRVRAVRYEQEGREREIPADHVWSTLPINLLVRLVRPEAPGDILTAASGLTFRGMILIYLVLEQDRFTEFDAHYFPEESIAISRLSEPKNYSETAEPRGRTVLCAELPCGADSPEWELTDDELGRMVCDCLARAGLPVVAPLRKVVTRRLKQAYPIYRRGYETRFALMDRWLDKIEGLLTFGRQGLFVHDNTHHALYMARAAAECLTAEGDFDHERWDAHREIFETHVVED
jgi:protoporphyrinogen oxidase